MWDEEIDYVLEEIEQSGQLINWKQINKVETSTPWLPTNGTAIDNDVFMCFATNAKLQYWSGTEIPVGMMIGLMGQVDFTPKMKDVVIRNGEELTVKQINTLAPNGVVVLYKVVFE
jgi:hypothetical protein